MTIPGCTQMSRNGLPALQIATPLAQALIYLHGAHVAEFTPAGHRPVLWMSSSSVFQAGKAIRGGIPLCAPWFGPHALDAKLPAHGLIRQRAWQVDGGEQLADGRVRVRLSIAANAEMLALWPHPFSAVLTVTVGHELEVELAVRNTGDAPFLLSEALHTYLAVSDVRQVRISGLAGATYLDKMDGGARKRQGSEPIQITAQTDRVYLSDEPATVVEDPGWKRTITVRKSGSGATVVWNPWSDKAAALSDFGDHEWPEMLCIEAANAADSVVAVPPSFTHHLTTWISVT